LSDKPKHPSETGRYEIARNIRSLKNTGRIEIVQHVLFSYWNFESTFRSFFNNHTGARILTKEGGD